MGSHEELGVPVGFGTCSEEIDVFIDPKLEERLMNPPKPPNTQYTEFEADFDVWMHMQAVGSKNHFNKL